MNQLLEVAKLSVSDKILIIRDAPPAMKIIPIVA